MISRKDDQKKARKENPELKKSAPGKDSAENPDASQDSDSKRVDTGLINEQIKQRPINRKKLLRRTIITACLAVLFGAIACAVFLVLEPVLTNKLYPKKEANTVSFPEESQNEEMSPEDMIADDSELASSAASEAAAAAASAVAAQQASNPVSDEQIEGVVQKVLASKDNSSTSAEYQDTYNMLKKIATDASASLVTVTGITSDYDLWGDKYENQGKTSGLILADNGTEFLILTPMTALEDADRIQISFCDNSKHDATLVSEDTITGFAIVGVTKSDCSDSTKQCIKTADLGSSAPSDLTGTPVIAIGSPNGTTGSISYGTVTGSSTQPDIPDTSFRLLTTDIYGSSQASGVLINLSGQVIGITDMSYNTSDMRNVLSAIGITDLKDLFEILSNGGTRPYFGIYGTDVTEQIQEEEGVPAGCYVRRTEIDSPAMDAGIQSGDVITSFGGTNITGFGDLVGCILNANTDQNYTLWLKRMGTNNKYNQLVINVTLTEQTSE
ncbi:MAG: S1C family serine protease [Lachnospiraceae bacterium]|jgi:S1-C subfamily serine protease|nr:S1C family serine protease [Lachnospiraceae bacterium]